jgi:soluble lytic murein transglycosylase-like protein
MVEAEKSADVAVKTTKGKIKKILRTGLTAALAIKLVTISVQPTSGIDCRNPIRFEVAAPNVELRTFREECIKEAKDIADSSLKKTGRYDFKELREVEIKYFSYLKSTNTQIEPFVGEFMPFIDKSAKLHNVSPEEIGSIQAKESAYFPYAVGKPPYYAAGLMQWNWQAHRATKKEYANMFDPQINIEICTRLYGIYKNEFKGDMDKALRAYYEGPGIVIQRKADKPGKKYVADVRNHEIAIRRINGEKQ